MSRILQSAREALAIAKDELDPAEYAVHVPENIDARENLKKLEDMKPGNSDHARADHAEQEAQ
jgi:hypothetical protein